MVHDGSQDWSCGGLYEDILTPNGTHDCLILYGQAKIQEAGIVNSENNSVAVAAIFWRLISILFARLEILAAIPMQDMHLIGSYISEMTPW